MDEPALLAPENFAIVENGVYRSSFPRSKNISFLRSLGLASVVPLIPEDYPKSMVDFYNSSSIELIQHGLDGNKWPFKEIDTVELMRTLISILKPNNRPLLIHCNKGKHRTGSVIGCLRKIRGWSLSSIFSEYLTYALPKSRIEDQMCIEAFDVQAFKVFARQQGIDIEQLCEASVTRIKRLPLGSQSDESNSTNQQET